VRSSSQQLTLVTLLWNAVLFDFAENCMFALHGLAVYRLTNAAAPGLLPFLRPYPLRISTTNASRVNQRGRESFIAE
jgi:hypothetical protein